MIPSGLPENIRTALEAVTDESTQTTLGLWSEVHLRYMYSLLHQTPGNQLNHIELTAQWEPLHKETMSMLKEATPEIRQVIHRVMTHVKPS